jgi:hypothetical protein
VFRHALKIANEIPHRDGESFAIALGIEVRL